MLFADDSSSDCARIGGRERRVFSCARHESWQRRDVNWIAVLHRLLARSNNAKARPRGCVYERDAVLIESLDDPTQGVGLAPTLGATAICTSLGSTVAGMPCSAAVRLMSAAAITKQASVKSPGTRHVLVDTGALY